jgi:hypothetical protein
MEPRADAEEPKLLRIQNGWLAATTGWAVRGTSPQKAIEAFHASLRWHDEIDRRPEPSAIHEDSLRVERRIRR